MTVPVAVSFDAVWRELPVVNEFAVALGVSVDTSDLETGLRLQVRFRNADGCQFWTEFDFREYPLYPPTIEFVSEDRTVRGTSALYPAGFHTMPCVCMRYNRKAYSASGGPHGDWRLVDWRLATPNGGPIDSIPLMISDLHTKIIVSRGRLG